MLNSHSSVVVSVVYMLSIVVCVKEITACDKYVVIINMMDPACFPPFVHMYS